MDGFGERLRRARGSDSQVVFARKLGISQVAYSRYELGQREPGIDCLYQIGIITGVSIDWLLGLSERGGSAGGGENAPGARHRLPTTNYQLPTSSPPPDCSRCKLMLAHIREITGRG